MVFIYLISNLGLARLDPCTRSLFNPCLTPELHCTRSGAKGKKVDFVLFITFEWLLNLMMSCLVRASQEMTEIDTIIREIEDCCGACCWHSLALLEGWSGEIFSSSSVKSSLQRWNYSRKALTAPALPMLDCCT